MVKLIISAFFLLMLTSCNSYQMLDGKSYPVFITPDSSVFSNPDFPRPSISYIDLLNIRGNSSNVVELKKGETAKVIIRQPTFFYATDAFLIYPREHIGIKRTEFNEFVFFKMNGNKRRNRELNFFKEFNNINEYPIIPHIDNARLDQILILEKELKIEISKKSVTSRLIFDSLIKISDVSEKFKIKSMNYLKNRYEISLFFLYETYKDTLRAHGIYKNKCWQLVQLFNDTKNIEEFDNMQLVFNEIINAVLPYKVFKISNKEEFESDFDTVLNNLNGIARDYVLSQLLYTAYTKRITVSGEHMKKYEDVSSTNIYRKFVSTVASQNDRISEITANLSTNSLLSNEGQKVYSLENILYKYSGKLVFLDFWATWCAPCREEMPY